MQEVKLAQESIDRIADAVTARITPAPADTSASVDVRRAAQILGLSTDAIRRMIRRGELPAYKVSGRIRIKQADLDAALVPIVTAAEGSRTTPSSAAARDKRPSFRELARRSPAGSKARLDAIERERTQR